MHAIHAQFYTHANASYFSFINVLGKVWTRKFGECYNLQNFSLQKLVSHHIIHLHNALQSLSHLFHKEVLKLKECAYVSLDAFYKTIILCIIYSYIYILANSLSPVIWYSYVPANLSLSMIT